MTSSRDFHSKPFDEGTKVKLRLFQNYLQEWLPVFVSRPGRCGRIYIIDFFAGPGSDCSGRAGSPLLTLKEIRKFTDRIRTSRAELHLILNEKSASKAKALHQKMVAHNVPKDLCTWEVEKMDFASAFEKYYDDIKTGPSLLFLDQTGMKFINDDVFSRITSCEKTDFMFFIASSSLRRFIDHPRFRRHLRIPSGSISARRFSETHRAVAEYYRGLIPVNTDYYLGAFSIKKGSNLYGLIFGSGHPLGMEKFLRVCWREDPTTGEANFDIDSDDIRADSPHLWSDMDKPRKITVFENALRQRILSGTLCTDRSVYLSALQEGVLPRHARVVLLELLKEGRVAMIQSGVRPRVSIRGYEEPRAFQVQRDASI